MDNELRLIRYLYGEEEHPEEVERLLAADSALRAEYRRLKATKDRLDARSPQRPDAAVVDRIVAAAERSAPTRPRTDREPVTRSRSPQRRVLGVTSILAVVLVVVGVGVAQWDGRTFEVPTLETLVDAQSATETQGEVAEEAALPEWDEPNDDVARLHHYIETLHVRSSPDSWDSPGAGLQPASQVRSSGH